jgi:HAD superfamily hydrolase (TIGR01509 family)
MAEKLQAILFDCDGVLAETERDGHRVAYNKAFENKGLDIHWSAQEYADLVRVSGGKERMRYFFEKNRARYPLPVFGDSLILELYLSKTEIFKEMLRSGKLPCRKGVERIIEEAREEGVQLFVCSTSHRESVETLIISNMGEKYAGYFTDLLCGDIVPNKKPAPDVYLLAKEKHKLDAKNCVVIEDSRNGLLAAKGAGMRCLVTLSHYTQDEDFDEADAILSTLGDAQTSDILIRGPADWQSVSYISLKHLSGLV